MADSKVVKSATRKPPNAGKGRVKGVPNKTTVTIKAAMLAVYEDLQAESGKEHGHFQAWAKENPTEYYKLAAKLLPLQVDVEAGPRLAKALTWLPTT